MALECDTSFVVFIIVVFTVSVISVVVVAVTATFVDVGFSLAVTVIFFTCDAFHSWYCFFLLLSLLLKEKSSLFPLPGKKFFQGFVFLE